MSYMAFELVVRGRLLELLFGRGSSSICHSFLQGVTFYDSFVIVDDTS